MHKSESKKLIDRANMAATKEVEEVEKKKEKKLRCETEQSNKNIAGLSQG